MSEEDDFDDYQLTDSDLFEHCELHSLRRSPAGGGGGAGAGGDVIVTPTMTGSSPSCYGDYDYGGSSGDPAANSRWRPETVNGAARRPGSLRLPATGGYGRLDDRRQNSTGSLLMSIGDREATSTPSTADTSAPTSACYEHGGGLDVEMRKWSAATDGSRCNRKCGEKAAVTKGGYIYRRIRDDDDDDDDKG